MKADTFLSKHESANNYDSSKFYKSPGEKNTIKLFLSFFFFF